MAVRQKDFYRESYSQRDHAEKRKDAVAELGLDANKNYSCIRWKPRGPQHQ